MAVFQDLQAYNKRIEQARGTEYPLCKENIYLDHGGTTLYASSLVKRYSEDLRSNLYGNPHSTSTPSQLTSAKVSKVRLRLLDFLGADPAEFDIVFSANATASIKLVMECFRDLAASDQDGHALGDHDQGSSRRHFWYGYHKDAHTSLLGVREVTASCHTCFGSDDEVESWLDGKYVPVELKTDSKNGHGKLGLFAYPGQSNMTGRRLPLTWSKRVRKSDFGGTIYTLFDAAALATTSPLNAVFASHEFAPDFTALSLYKIFGLPDLGALVLRKRSAHILTWRKYFGGGTIDMATVFGGPSNVWHRSKNAETSVAGGHASADAAAGVLCDPVHGETYELHDQLEDGTLPFHSIIAVDAALDVHQRLFTSMACVSAHTQSLIKHLHRRLCALRHSNGLPVLRIYNDESVIYGIPSSQGATIAFNVLTAKGMLIPYLEVDAAADAQNIYVRSGGLCNPGGVATYCKLSPWEMRRAWGAGHRCGNGKGEGGPEEKGKAMGVVRVSLGAMSIQSDVNAFVDFISERYVASDIRLPVEMGSLDLAELHIEGSSHGPELLQQNGTTRKPGLSSSSSCSYLAHESTPEDSTLAGGNTTGQTTPMSTRSRSATDGQLGAQIAGTGPKQRRWRRWTRHAKSPTANAATAAAAAAAAAA